MSQTSENSNPDKRLEFSFWEAGCLIWVGAKDLGGLDYHEFCELLWNNQQDKLQEMIYERKAFLTMDLYQDDGYRVRVVQGELNEQEQEEWVARVRWRLNLGCGQMVISGVLGEATEFAQMPQATGISEEQDWLECYLEVSPQEYQVEVYAYAPGDLSTGWGQITNPDLFAPTPGIEPESLINYFARTRPHTPVPAWIGCEIETEPQLVKQYYEQAYAAHYIDFVIRLSPLLEDLQPPPLTSSGSVQWEFRKPVRCPLGLIAAQS